MRDREGTPRGFGYVTFQNSSDAEKVMSQKELKIYGKVVDIKYAISKADMARQERGQLTGVPPVRTSKIFVGGLAHQTTKETFRAYFNQFGHITDSVVMSTKAEGRGRGFGFVTFDSSDVAEEVLARAHIIDGKQVDCQRAHGLVPRSTASPVPLYSSSFGFDLPSRFATPLLPLTDPRFPSEPVRALVVDRFEPEEKAHDRARLLARGDEEFDRAWQRWGWDPYGRPWPSGGWPSFPSASFGVGALEMYNQSPQRVLASRVAVPFLPRQAEAELDRSIHPRSFRTPYLQGTPAIRTSPPPWTPDLGGTRPAIATYSHFDQPRGYRARALGGLV